VSVTACEDALVEAVKGLFPGVTTEDENKVPAEPAPKTKWMQLFALGSDPRPDTLGSAGEDRVDAVFQVTMNYPTGTGRAAAKADYEILRGTFKAGAVLSHDGQAVNIVACGMRTGSRTPIWYKIHFSITWFAFVPR
jgi:hypothetical protein